MSISTHPDNLCMEVHVSESDLLARHFTIWNTCWPSYPRSPRQPEWPFLLAWHFPIWTTRWPSSPRTPSATGIESSPAPPPFEGLGVWCFPTCSIPCLTEATHVRYKVLAFMMRSDSPLGTFSITLAFFDLPSCTLFKHNPPFIKATFGTVYTNHCVVLMEKN